MKLSEKAQSALDKVVSATRRLSDGVRRLRRMRIQGNCPGDAVLIVIQNN